MSAMTRFPTSSEIEWFISMVKPSQARHRRRYETGKSSGSLALRVRATADRAGADGRVGEAVVAGGAKGGAADANQCGPSFRADVVGRPVGWVTEPVEEAVEASTRASSTISQPVEKRPSIDDYSGDARQGFTAMLSHSSGICIGDLQQGGFITHVHGNGLRHICRIVNGKSAA
ncbi:hypothetical protein ACWGM0_10715 [Sphingomonas bisphenolicum]